MRKASLGVCFVALTLGAAQPANAVPLPSSSAYQATWTKYGCASTDDGYRSFGGIRTEVLELPDRTGVYYQQVDIRIDKQVGFSATSPTWRKVENEKYDWSRFTAASLPTYSTSGVRTGLQPDTGILSAKATVTLRRVRTGPDKKVWRYTVRSSTFSCSRIDGAG